MLKWRRSKAYNDAEYPKGYLLERIAGEKFDSTRRDHAEGFVQLLRNVVQSYEAFALAGGVPSLADPGVPTHNVLHRLTAADFKFFVAQAKSALSKAEKALASTDKGESARLWRELFGSDFPEGPGTKAAFPPSPVRPPNRPE